MLAAAQALARLRACNEVRRVCAMFEIGIPSANLKNMSHETNVPGCYTPGHRAPYLDMIRDGLVGLCIKLRSAMEVAQKCQTSWSNDTYPTAGTLVHEFDQRMLVPLLRATSAYVRRVDDIMPLLIAGSRVTSNTDADDNNAIRCQNQAMQQLLQTTQDFEAARDACNAYDPVADFLPDWQRVAGPTSETMIELLLCSAIVDSLSTVPQREPDRAPHRKQDADPRRKPDAAPPGDRPPPYA